MKSIVPEFYHVLAKRWVLNLQFNQTFQVLINFFVLFHNILNIIWTAPTFVGAMPLTLSSWQQAHINPWCSSWHLVAIVHDVGFHVGWKQLHALSFKHVQLLSSTSRHCVHQRLHSHLIRRCHYWPNMSIFTSLILCHPRICYFWCDSSERTKLSQPTPCRLIPPLSSGGIWTPT